MLLYGGSIICINYYNDDIITINWQCEIFGFHVSLLSVLWNEAFVWENFRDLYIFTEKIKQVDLIECYFSLDTDKESSDKEAEIEGQVTSSESESEESDHDSNEEEARTQSDTEADVGLQSLLEDPSAEKQSDSRVSLLLYI